MGTRRARADTAAQPHDGIIKYAFSRREHAVGLVKAALDPQVAALVDWSTLKLEKDSFIDRALRGRFIDLLFSARLGADRLHVYTLIEQHKVVLWALSVAGDDARFLAEIGRMSAAIQEALAAPDHLDAAYALLRYLVSTHQRLGARRIAKVVQMTAGKEQGKVIMDVLDEFKREGRVEGRREGASQLLLGQLAARFGRVPATVKARVLAADDSTLARWSLGVLTAPTLDAVLESTAKKTKAAKKTPAARKTARATRVPSR